MTKATVRARIRGERQARAADARAASATAIAAQARALLPDGPVTVTCFLSMPAEPGTDPLITRLHESGHRVLVPRIRGRELDWVELHDDSSLTPGPLGIREPQGTAQDPAQLSSTAVMFIPAIAVDQSGRRLGQGGGYYDRVLAGVPLHMDGGPLRVAVLYDEEILDHVPAEPHDCRVDAVVTPSGVVRFSPP
jgi:5-formyltetrahydrofolate cyclo-ligase